MNNPDYMKNAQGHLVPVESIKPEDRLEDDLVCDLYSRAVGTRQAIQQLKCAATEEISAFTDLLREKYGVVKGGTKGNMTLMSFDGLTKIVISNAEFIQFGAQLKVAKDLLDEFIKDEAEDANANIRTLVMHAFRVDKEGQVNKASVLGLRRLKIDNDKWKSAMDAITDSIRVAATKQYIRFYSRAEKSSVWQAVALDIAAV